MATAQTELTNAHAERATEQTELIEKLNCLEYEASQLNRAYQLWRSCVEQRTPPDWMAVAIRITYDALIKFYLDVSIIQAEGPHAFSARHLAPLEAADCEIPGIGGEESTIAESSTELWSMTEPDRSEPTELTTEQAELIEKLNCLEFEISQLNRAYQLWRSYVEKGTIPDWMGAAIRITYDALIKFYLEVSTIEADVPDAFSTKHVALLETADCESSGILEEQSATVEPPAELSLMTEPDWCDREMLAAISVPSTDETILELPGIEQGQLEEEPEEEEDEADVPHAFSARHLAPLEAADCEIPGIGGEESTITELSPELLAITQPEWSRPEMPAPISPLLTDETISEEPAIQQEEEAYGLNAFSAKHVAQLEAADCEIAGISGEESTAVELSPELLPMRECDWCVPLAGATSPFSTADTISELPAPQSQQEEEVGAEPAIIHIPATLAKWLQGSSNTMLFLAASVAILIIVGGAMGIYLASPHHASPPTLSVKNSGGQAEAGALAIPTGEKAAFKFDPDLVVAPQGSSFVLNAVLSRGSDIASVAAQIDYDANLLQFMGVSQGGFLVKDGQQVVLAQRNDPLTGVLRISAEEPPGKPGISGDGPVFALSFQARKRGMATVSIVPGAHDSQGRRIEMTGSQVAVRVD